MKELSIKEKAKRYDEAIERAKGAHNNAKSDKENGVTDKITEYTIQLTETIFPELKMSEDEKIRKQIISFLKEFEYDHYRSLDFSSWIAWLEKQGKQSSNILWHDVSEEPDEKREIFCEWKSSTGTWHSVVFYYADSKAFFDGEGMVQNVVKWTYVNEMLEKQGNNANKVEPIFEVGKWIVANEKKYTFLVKRGAPRYQVEDTNGDIYSFYLLPNGEKEYHLWSIEDAKDGDVLVFEGYYNSIVLFQGIGINGKGRINYHCKCDLGNYSFGIQGDVACLGTIEKDAEHYHPATKEQRDLLFQKMKEAGYEWNEDKKELIKL